MENMSSKGISENTLSRLFDKYFGDDEKSTKKTKELRLKLSQDGLKDAVKDIDELNDALEKYYSMLNKNGTANNAKFFVSEERAVNKLKSAWNQYVKERNSGLTTDQNVASSAAVKDLIAWSNALEALTGSSSQIADISEEMAAFIAQMKDTSSFKNYSKSVDVFKELFDVLSNIQRLGTNGADLVSMLGISEGFSPVIDQVEELLKITTQFNNNSGTNDTAEVYEKQGQAAEEAAEKIERLTKAEMERKLKAEHQRGYVDEYKYDYSYDEDKLQKYADKLEELKSAQADALGSAVYYHNKLANGETQDWYGDSVQEHMEGSIRLYHEYEDAIEVVQNKLQEAIKNYSPAADGENAKELNALVLILRDLHGEIVKISSAFQSFNSEGLSTFLSSIKELGGTTNILDVQQFQELNEIFKKIESSLDSMKSVLVDVGDGEEFSPLFKVVASLQDSITNLGESVSNIKFNVNMDLGSEVNERLNQKISKSMNRQLEAYRNLFNAMKSTGKTNKEMLRFFEPEDVPISEIIGAYKEVISRAEKQFGKDVYKSKLGKSYDDYLKEVRNATDQFNRTTNKKKVENPLGDLFGKNELIEITSQLGIIANKLDEMALSASGLKNTFTEGTPAEETSGLDLLKKSVDSITESVNAKTEAFKNEAATVAKVVPEETNYLGKLISALKIINENLEKISDFAGIDLSKIQIPAKTSLPIIEKVDITSGNQTKVLSGTQTEVLSGDKIYDGLEQVSEDQYRLTTDIGLSHDELIAKIKTETEAIEAGNAAFKERLTFLDAQGNVIESYLGEKDAVYGMGNKYDGATKAVHTHPSIDDYGGNFSTADIYNFANEAIYNGLKEVELVWRDKVVNLDFSGMSKEAIEQFADQYAVLKKTLMTHFNDESEGGMFKNINEQLKNSEYTVSIMKKLVSDLGGNVTSNQELLGIDETELNNILNLFKQIQSVYSKIGEDTTPDQIAKLEEELLGIQRAYKLNQTPLSSTNQEVVESEKKVAQVTEESREKAATAVKKHAKETKQASEEVLAALKQLEDEKKQVYSDESFANRDIISQYGIKEIHKELGQDGELHDVGSFSFLEKLQDGQLQRVLVTYNEATGEWYEQAMGVSTAFEKVGNEIISLDNKIKQYEMSRDKQVAAHPTYDTSADDKLIELAKERRQVLLDTLGIYHDEEEYAYKRNEFDVKRQENAERLNALEKQNINLLQAKADDKATKSAEQYANAVAKANSHLNTQEIKLEHIEQTYNKAVNNSLEKSVTNPQDLAELEAKKNEIQNLINQLKNTPRDASNEQDYLNLEKMIASYKDLAAYKKKANNPTKGELGGQNLPTLIAVQINEYQKLIEKAKTFGDQTEANVQLLEEQLEKIKRVDENGNTVATADDYYEARDLLKVEKSSISLIESRNKKSSGNIESKIKKSYEKELKLEQEINKLRIKNVSASKEDIAANDVLIKHKEDLVEKERSYRTAMNLVSSDKEAELINKKTSLIQELTAAQEAYNAKVKEELAINSKKKIDETIQFVDNLETRFGRIKTNKKKFKYDATYIQEVDALDEKIAAFNQQKGLNIVSEDQFEKLKALSNEIETLFNTVSAHTKNFDFQLVNKEDLYEQMREVRKTLDENTAMPFGLKELFRSLEKKYQIVIDNHDVQGTVAKVAELNEEFAELKYRLQESGKTGNSVFTLIGKKIKGLTAQFFAMYFSLYDALNLLRQGFSVIKEYDQALTEMNKVSDENIATLKRFQKESFALADSIGATASAIQNSTADWLRLGESLKDAQKSAQATNVLFNVSEFESIDEATESLISMSQAYKDLDKMDIVDIMNNIGNNYAISTDGLATALQKSASSLTTAGNDINEAVALITAGNAVAQDPESVGAGLRIISLRLTGTKEAKEELESLGEETDDVITTTSKLRDTIISATKAASEDGKGFDILDSNGNYKSTYEIMLGLSGLYEEIVKKDKELGTNNLNLLLETIAGKNRSNIAASILQNSELLESVYNSSLDSEGSAMKENEAYLESIEGHLNQLSNAWDNLWVNDGNREVINFFLDLAKGILKVVDDIGVLNTALIGIGTALSIKSAVSGNGRHGKTSPVSI